MFYRDNRLYTFSFQSHDGLQYNLQLFWHTFLLRWHFPFGGQVVWIHPLGDLTSLFLLLGRLCLNHGPPLTDVHFYKSGRAYLAPK